MKFSIRDLFLVTVIAALAAGWWADRAMLHDKLDELQQRLQPDQPSPEEFIKALRGRENKADSINPPVIQHGGPIVDTFGSVPNTSSPALNQPKSE